MLRVRRRRGVPHRPAAHQAHRRPPSRRAFICGVESPERGLDSPLVGSHCSALVPASRDRLRTFMFTRLITNVWPVKELRQCDKGAGGA